MLRTLLATIVMVIFFPYQSFALVGCSEAGAKATGKSYKIKGTEINVRQGPSTKDDKIINQKATAILHKTHYITIDNSVTVYEECSVGSWSKIRVTDPEWLTSSHRGWIASKFLRRKNVDASGLEIFTEDDFIWSNKISPYKDIIIAGVNKIHRENSGCKDIDPASAYISGSKGTISNPVFFVTCGKGAGIHNVFFSK
ncbi:MAG: SH3 domain-containing protein, partial [Alphaproteobacteria bacterium]|nr:SH3 domain-containing protein [Alphaproteobacteria bacterium]